MDALPSLGARHNPQLAPLNTSAGPVPRSSHGTRHDKSSSGSQRNHGLGQPQNLGQLPQPLLPFQGQAPPSAPSSGSQTARQIRSSGGPRMDPLGSRQGPLTARPSSKGNWATHREGNFGFNDDRDIEREREKERRKEEERDKEKEKEKAMAQLPLTPAKVLKNHIHELTEYEQGEILDFPQVWHFGAGAQKVRGTSQAANNHGYDDERGDYSIVLHDHVLYRYEVMTPLGKGSFGQVVRAYDYKTNSYVALKMIRNKKRFHHQALVEVKILEHIRERDVENTSNVVHLLDYFYFRSHLCITFELLSINLYEFIKNNNFQGVSLGLIRRFAIQLLAALRFLRKQHIIHCDLKPENVLLKNPTKSGIKVIDLGSSCFEDERVYTYIQSRFYRSPEVILGIPYDVAIDMWSFGCILAELYTGYPLFPGENEMEQFACIMEICGLPPQRILENSTRYKMFFDSNGNPRLVPNSRGKTRRPGGKELQAVLRTTETRYVDFLQGCLQWHPRERFTPEDALQQEWILEGYARHAAQREQRGDHGGSGIPSSSSKRLGSSSNHRSHHRSSGGGGNNGGSSATSAALAGSQGNHAVMSATGTTANAAASGFLFPRIEGAGGGGQGGHQGGLPPPASKPKSSRLHASQAQDQGVGSGPPLPLPGGGTNGGGPLGSLAHGNLGGGGLFASSAGFGGGGGGGRLNHTSGGGGGGGMPNVGVALAALAPPGPSAAAGFGNTADAGGGQAGNGSGQQPDPYAMIEL
eukprot:TRINITY_DN1505_c0_g1_i2.p1 TRINITY_DN1505_c0_g1~~TRINITY_DN1505_c0_g1_i2.p1  ORF type:complete len:753 (-),score=155.35 TRINITY_DN1505_c0_g1_i2:78-2336(-)